MKSGLATFADQIGLARGLPPSNSLRIEILSGLTVALALVPEAVAFAFVAGVHPLVGLYAAFIVGLITALIGGRPGMISGATGALAVVMVSLVAQHGVEYLFADRGADGADPDRWPACCAGASSSGWCRIR